MKSQLASFDRDRTEYVPKAKLRGEVLESNGDPARWCIQARDVVVVDAAQKRQRTLTGTVEMLAVMRDVANQEDADETWDEFLFSFSQPADHTLYGTRVVEIVARKSKARKNSMREKSVRTKKRISFLLENALLVLQDGSALVCDEMRVEVTDKTFV